MLSVFSAMGCNLHLMGIARCEVTLGNITMVYSISSCKHLTEDIVIGLVVQQIYCTGCDWTTDGQMHLH